VGFEIVGELQDLETIASGRGIGELRRLERAYGRTRWRKRKGIARIRFANGDEVMAELHWYEGHGIGRREFKIKQIVHD
jgi:hypothetical protein